MFKINMNTLSGLAVGILVGVAATLATHANQADPQRTNSDYYGGGAWHAAAVPSMTANGPAIAWRINSFTGQMEMCNSAPQPKCVAMPAPGK